MSREANPQQTAAPILGRKRLSKASVVSIFLLLSTLVLYTHLLLFPRHYGQGELSPYPVFAPASFIYEDSELLSTLRGSDEFKVIDHSVKERVLARYANFRRDFAELRGDVLSDSGIEPGENARPAEQQLLPFLPRIGVMAERYKLDPAALKFYLSLEERDAQRILASVEEALAGQLDGVVSREGLRTLREGGVQQLYLNPVQLYAWFLETNVLDWNPPEITAEQRKAASVEVPKGSLVVGEGSEISARAVQQMAELKESFAERRLYRFLAAILLILLLMFLWYRYLKRFAPRILERASTISQLCALWLFFLSLGIIIARLPFDHFYYGVSFAVASLAIVVVLIYDARFALYFSLGLGLVLGVALSFSTNMMVYTLGAAMLPPVLLFPGCQRRVQVLFALKQGALNLLLAAMVLLVSMARVEWEVLAIAAISGIGAAVVALGLLPVIETITMHLTPGKLTDLVNPENPLLRRLKHEAHGTFVHSTIVADLTEEACKAIGADCMLAKAGALYHDIGKLKRPGFFAENIHDLAKNPHIGLPPETSAKIITDHVRDGLAMAREAGLPYDLLAFIAEHHGDYVIRYFYHKAKKLHEEDPEKHPAPNVSDFRYEGPLPQSRETGVLMLADVTEAIVRSSPASTAEELKAIVSEVVREKLTEEQLIDSGLTVGDLKLVAEAFLEILSAQRHARIVYPEAQAAVDFHHGRPRAQDLKPAPKGKGG